MLDRSSFSSLVLIALVPLTLLAAPAQKILSTAGHLEEPTLTEIKKLQADDGQTGDHFGEYVAISGDTAVVGAHQADTSGADVGAAYVFQRDEGGDNNWGQVRKLLPEDPQVGGRFGRGAIHGGTAVVGAFGSDTGAGAAYVFKRNQGGKNNWGQIQKLQAADREPGDSFGVHTAISGRTALVGAWASDTAGFNAGAAYIFRRHQGGKNNWGQVKKLLAADAQPGDRLGIGVAISGDTVVVGAFGEDSGGLDAGAAYVFQRHEGGRNNWGQVQKLQAGDAQPKDQFGGSTAIRGDTVVIGALESGPGVGAAYVFKRNEGGNNNWGQVQKLQASDAQPGDRFGASAAMTGDTALVGNYLSTNAEAVYVFSTPEGFDASGDAPPAIDSLLADSSQDGGELICRLAIASGNNGLAPKSRFRFHIGFGHSGFAANTTLTYQVGKSGRRCTGAPSLVCSEEEIDLDGNIDANCDGNVAGSPAAACIVTLRAEVGDITERWLDECTGNDCLTPFPDSGSISEYDVYTFWSTKRKKDLDRVPDTDNDHGPDSTDEVVTLTLVD